MELLLEDIGQQAPASVRLLESGSQLSFLTKDIIDTKERGISIGNGHESSKTSVRMTFGEASDEAAAASGACSLRRWDPLDDRWISSDRSVRSDARSP